MKQKKRSINEAWIEQVKSWLDANEPDAQKTLAARVGCSSPSLTYILQGRQSYSKYVEAISRVTGATLPPDEPLADDELEVLGRFRELSPREKAIAIAQLDVLVKSRLGD